MTEPRQTFARAAAWWGAIEAGVTARESTSSLWGRIHAYTAQQGLREPPSLFLEVNRLRSTAKGLREATRQLGLALNGDAITGSMVGQTIYARGATARGLVRQFHVRVQFEAVKNGEAYQDFVTLGYTGALPGTVGQLREDAYATAEGIVLSSAPHSGGAEAFIGTGAIEIGEW
jgi:hypothetical protein